MYFSLIDDIRISVATAKANSVMKQIDRQERKRKKKLSKVGGNNTSEDNKEPAKTCPVPTANATENVFSPASTKSMEYRPIAQALIERARPFATKEKRFEEYEEEYWEIYNGFKELMEIHGYIGDREFDDMYAALRSALKDV